MAVLDANAPDEAIKARLRHIIAVVLETNYEAITEQTPLATLGMDSLLFIELIDEVERQFRLKFTDLECQGLLTLSDIYLLVAEKHGERTTHRLNR